ncbi:TRAF type zinc finger domain containing 1 [Zea mays]|uniref:TRAF type zinc finger domain containing 1 n=1 Tax=Zea mays TaxID=4577 RepID=A0A1D6K3J4_MAIZE|nr:TRAF type zinc finger domain containing 1 [Zea mays]
MAAAAADSDTAAAVGAMSTCAHCQREIPFLNIDLHSVHCARNLQKCQHCGEMIPRKLMDEHYDENHAPINCSLCKETIERESWDLHKGEKCPQRIVACEYCEFELPAVDLHEHQSFAKHAGSILDCVNGQGTKYSAIQTQMVLQTHPDQCLSTARAIPERELRPPPPPVRQARPARPAHASPHKRLLFTIAVTGIAVMIGSILFQRDEGF